MSHKIEVVSLTSNDLGINYGPSIHYLELWNSVEERFPNISITGVYPSWTAKPPIIDTKFPLKRARVRGRGIRQVLWDIRSAFTVLTTRADIVYLRISSFHVFTLLALKLKSIPLAVEINGSAIADGVSASRDALIQKVAKFCEDRLIKRASVTFSVTRELSQNANQINPKARNIHVENGVSKRFFTEGRGVDGIKQQPVCIYVGTFTAWDGAALIPEIARNNPHVKFQMVGDGGLRRKVEKDAPGNMSFLGWVPYADLPIYYEKADCAIVLYEEERHASIGSSPLKIREYLASRLPVFTSTAAGTEIIDIYGVGARVSHDFSYAFSSFIGSLPEFRGNYEEHYGEILDQISWFSVADVTGKELLSLVPKVSRNLDQL